MQLSFILAVLAVVAPSQAFFCEYNQNNVNFGNVGRYGVQIYQSNAMSGFWNDCWNGCNGNSGCTGWTWEYNRKADWTLVLAKCVYYWQWVMTYNEQHRSNEGKLTVRDRGNYYGSDYACGGYYFQHGKYWAIVKKSEISNSTTGDFEKATELQAAGKTDEAIVTKRWSTSDFPLVNYANPDSTNFASPDDYYNYYNIKLGNNPSNFAQVWI